MSSSRIALGTIGRNTWRVATLPLLLAACTRALLPYLFVEQPFTVPAIAGFLVLILIYTLLWETPEHHHLRSSAPQAVLLLLALSGAAVILDPYGGLPPRWSPSDLRELPGVFGVLIFLFTLSYMSVRIVADLFSPKSAEHGSWDQKTQPTSFLLPIPIYVVWVLLEGVYRGQVIPAAICFSFSILLYLWASLIDPRLPKRFERIGASVKEKVVLLIQDDRAFALLIGLFAFTLRAIFAYKLNRASFDPNFLGGPDSGTYDMTAWSLASGEKGILDPSLNLFGFNPGPSLIYSLLYKLIGHHPDWIRYFQAALAAFTVILLFRLARDLFGAGVARVAAFLIAGRGYLIGYGTYLGSETLGLLFLTLVTLLLLRVKRLAGKGEDWRAVGISAGAAGLLLGALTLTRQEYQFFVFFGAAWLWCVVPSKKARTLGMWFAGFLIALSPMMIRNHMAVGHFALNSPTQVVVGYGLRSLDRHVPRPNSIYEGRFFKETLDFALAHPLLALRAVGGDMAHNFYVFWYWKNHVSNPAFVYLIRNERLIMLIGVFLASAFFLGLIASRSQAATLSLLYLLIGYKTLFHLATVNHEWWRFTIEPFVNLFQGLGVYLIAEYVSKGWPLWKVRLPAVSTNRVELS